ncbi:MAG: hypothetical protein ACSHX0_00535 [Akkermansiaceae bacterium]
MISSKEKSDASYDRQATDEPESIKSLHNFTVSWFRLLGWLGALSLIGGIATATGDRLFSLVYVISSLLVAAEIFSVHFKLFLQLDNRTNRWLKWLTPFLLVFTYAISWSLVTHTVGVLSSVKVSASSTPSTK